jgi:hypothetical protein
MTNSRSLDTYVNRGGGLVSFHDTLCSPAPEYDSTIVVGAKTHWTTRRELDTAGIRHVGASACGRRAERVREPRRGSAWRWGPTRNQ